MDVQEQLGFFYRLRLGAGLVTVIGALLFIFAILVPRDSEVIASDMKPAPAE